MMSILAERILRQPGQDPNNPVCILAAPTGKAASIIGIYDLFFKLFINSELTYLIDSFDIYP